MKLSNKTQLNLKALGLGIYMYIVFFLFLGLFFGAFSGGTGISIYMETLKSSFSLFYFFPYILFPLFLLLIFLSRFILSKNSAKSILEFIYISLSIVCILLILTTIFPFPGWG